MEYNNDESAAQVAARLKESFRDQVEAARAALPALTKALKAQRSAVQKVEAKYRGVMMPPDVQRIYGDLIHGNAAVELVQGRIEQWENISENSVNDWLQRWPIDVNRLTVLENDIAFGLKFAHGAPAIISKIADLEWALAEDDKWVAANGPHAKPMMIPTPAKQPRQVIVNAEHKIFS
jgi:hypothetical protein